MTIPVNRIVAFLGPYIAIASSGAAAWLVAKVNILAIPGLDQGNVQTYIAAGLTAALVAGLHALGGWQWLKGHHIVLAATKPPAPSSAAVVAAVGDEGLDPLFVDEPETDPASIPADKGDKGSV